VRMLTEQARSSMGTDWQLSAEDVYPLLDSNAGHQDDDTAT